jgi:hypothetical protein
MNVSIKGANRYFGNSLGFSWLWGCFEGLEFGVQFLEKKQDVFFSSLGDSKSVCFNDSFN